MKEPVVFSPDQARCVEMLAHWVCGAHHLPKVHPFGTGVAINFRGDLSSYDFDRLTRLVILAHKYAIRVGISSSGPGKVKIIAHARIHGSYCQFSRHPDLDGLVEMIAKFR